MTRAMFLIVALCAFAAPVAAQQIEIEQPEDCASYKRAIANLMNGNPGAEVIIVDLGQNARCFTRFVASQPEVRPIGFKDFIRRIEASRADKQTGSGPASSGGTSIVAQGPVAKVISVATEYGALTQSVTNQVITVRGNLAGVPTVLAKKDIFPYCPEGMQTPGCVSGGTLNLLKRVSFAVSFDPSRTKTVTATPDSTTPSTEDTQLVTFTGSGREISAASVHVDIWNRRDTTSKEFADAWRKQVGAAVSVAARDLQDAGSFIEDVLDSTSNDWKEAQVRAFRDAGKDRQRIIAQLHLMLDDLLKNVRELPNYQQRVTTLANAYSRFMLAQDEVINSIATKNVLAFEYTNTRPVAQPSMSNYRVIFDCPLTKQTKIVANGAFTFYDKQPADQTVAKRFRDAQVGAELDQSLGELVLLGPAVFSVAGYFQYQHAPALLKVDPAAPVSGVSFTGLPATAKTVFTKTGNIGLVQAKLSLVPTGSAVKIPLSVTWSNRTELIDKPVFRGQIGISYDFDALFAGLGAK